MGNDLVFQQDGASGDGAKVPQAWLRHHCPHFIDKDSWPPKNRGLNPFDYYVEGAMLEEFKLLSPKSQKVTELKWRCRQFEINCPMQECENRY